MAYKKPGGDGWGRLGWLVLKLLSGAFEAFAEDLHILTHHSLLLVEELFVLAGESGETSPAMKVLSLFRRPAVS